MRTITAAASKAAKPAKKTTTSGRSGASQPGRKKPRAKDLDVRKFSVTERWVEITAKIHAEHAEILALTSKEEIFNSYSASMWIAASYRGSKCASWYDIRLDAARWGYGRGKKLVEIRFSVIESKWLSFLTDCEAFDYSPAEILRGMFAAKATGKGMPGHRDQERRKA